MPDKVVCTDKADQALEELKTFLTTPTVRSVKAMPFQVGDLIWKTILPIGSRSNKFGKWSLSWEGPYKIVRVCSGNSYMVESLQGQSLPWALNGRYLKFYPSVWQDA
jgi:hypothetical protein